MDARPIIALTCSLDDREARLRRTYIDAVIQAGGLPVLLTPPRGVGPDEIAALASRSLDVADALVLTGGPDPSTEAFGAPTHPKAELVHPDRQRFEVAVLAEVARRPELPVLGVCLGMQLMALTSGGTLNQHLPDDTPTASDHAEDRVHRVIPCDRSAWMNAGEVTSWHHQAVRSAGAMRVLARAHDGIIEAIDQPRRRFFLGVQWHPERTRDEDLGAGIYRRLVEEAVRARRIRSRT